MRVGVTRTGITRCSGHAVSIFCVHMIDFGKHQCRTSLKVFKAFWKAFVIDVQVYIA
jgi:hypothetical protein